MSLGLYIHSRVGPSFRNPFRVGTPLWFNLASFQLFCLFLFTLVTCTLYICTLFIRLKGFTFYGFLHGPPLTWSTSYMVQLLHGSPLTG